MKNIDNFPLVPYHKNGTKAMQIKVFLICEWENDTKHASTITTQLKLNDKRANEP